MERRGLWQCSTCSWPGWRWMEPHRPQHCFLAIWKSITKAVVTICIMAGNFQFNLHTPRRAELICCSTRISKRGEVQTLNTGPQEWFIPALQRQLLVEKTREPYAAACEVKEDESKGFVLSFCIGCAVC